MCVGQAKPAVRRGGLALIFFRNPSDYPFASKQKEQKSIRTRGKTYLFFLLLVQKKEPKKSTPAMIPIAIGTAVAGRLDLASVLLLTVLNNSYHRHRRSMKFSLFD
jgi:hypothetical protein